MKLFILSFRLLFFELFNFVFLFQEAAFDLFHVLVGFDHLGEEVIWTFDWDFGLDAYFHGFHDVLSCVIVEKEFSGDVRVYL